MSNLRKLALSHSNIAKVHSHKNEEFVSETVLGKPDWKLRKHSRFIRNLLKTGVNGDIDEIIKVVGNSSPIYNNILRTEHLILLMAAQSVMTFNTLARYSIGTIHMLVVHQLLEAIPHIPGVRSKRVFLSYKGFQLLDHWNKKYKRFQSYYNAFVNEDIRGKAKEYSVIRAIGGVHKDIKEIVEINTEMDRKILKREKTFKLQRTIQDSIRKKVKLPYLTTGPSTSVVSTTLCNPHITTTVTLLSDTVDYPTTTRGGLFGSIFGGK